MNWFWRSLLKNTGQKTKLLVLNKYYEYTSIAAYGGMNGIIKDMQMLAE